MSDQPVFDYDYDGPKRPNLIKRAIAALRSRAEMVPAEARLHAHFHGRH